MGNYCLFRVFGAPRISGWEGEQWVQHQCGPRSWAQQLPQPHICMAAAGASPELVLPWWDLHARRGEIEIIYRMDQYAGGKLLSIPEGGCWPFSAEGRKQVRICASHHLSMPNNACNKLGDDKADTGGMEQIPSASKSEKSCLTLIFYSPHSECLENSDSCAARSCVSTCVHKYRHRLLMRGLLLLQPKYL